MGWERRQRGAVYYYKSVKIDGRTRKHYLGKGRAAEAEARRAAEARRRRQDDHAALLADMEQVAAADQALADLGNWMDLLLRATLHLQGFHQHRGQWRQWRYRGGA